MTSECLFSGYITGSKKAKKRQEKYFKKHPETKDFIKEAADYIDKILAYGEDEETDF